MSVRMALAKLCACTCGGAIIGGGAMQISDVPSAQAQAQSCCTTKKVVRKRHAARKPVKRVRRVVTTKRVIRTETPQTRVVTQTVPLPPIPYAPFPPRGSWEGGGSSGSGLTVIGGGFGGGFGGGLGGGFGGGFGSVHDVVVLVEVHVELRVSSLIRYYYFKTISLELGGGFGGGGCRLLRTRHRRELHQDPAHEVRHAAVLERKVKQHSPDLRPAKALNSLRDQRLVEPLLKFLDGGKRVRRQLAPHKAHKLALRLVFGLLGHGPQPALGL